MLVAVHYSAAADDVDRDALLQQAIAYANERAKISALVKKKKKPAAKVGDNRKMMFYLTLR